MSQAPNARRPDKPVTLKTLAAHLGYSPATVSVVLNDVPGRSIPDSTRERIKAVARALGYSPNVLAQSLRTKRTRTIGVVLPDVASSYHAQLLSGIVNHLAHCYFGISPLRSSLGARLRPAAGPVAASVSSLSWRRFHFTLTHPRRMLNLTNFISRNFSS